MSESILKIDGLVKRFGGLVATDHAHLDVKLGSVHALIGPNGAGKTTLIHQMSGALRSDEGRILFNGTDVTTVPMHLRAQAGLVRSYQITSIFRKFSVLDNLALAVQARSGSSMRIWSPASAERARFEESAALAARVGLAGREYALAGSLSHGEQRQLELGIALATRPKLLLLDEPMAGMGPDESARMVELLLELRQEATLLLVEHDMDAVFKLADTISVLVFGKVIASGDADAIRSNADVKRAYLGDEAESH